MTTLWQLPEVTKAHQKEPCWTEVTIPRWNKAVRKILDSIAAKDFGCTHSVVIPKYDAVEEIFRAQNYGTCFHCKQAVDNRLAAIKEREEHLLKNKC